MKTVREIGSTEASLQYPFMHLYASSKLDGY